MWLSHLGYEKVVREAWCNHIIGSPSFTLVQKIKIIKDELKRLNKVTFSNLKAKKWSLKLSLNDAQQNLESSHASKKEREIRKELELLADQEQIFWM